jgi:sigma-B regulation protein RsbU (phosphoserine phosphatase)
MTSPQTASVLVVDDVAENRDLLVRRLKRLGITDVEEAVNGVAALAAIERRNFDLVLLDIMMPEMNGYQVLEHLRQNGRIHDLPIIVISALTEIEPVVRCIELGAEDYVSKPFNPTLLRARVMATLEKKALRDITREELRRKQNELTEARTLQLALAPAPFRGTVGGQAVSVDVILEPAKEVGGDLVDHFRIGDDLLVLVLGDVSDKGAGAALVMARTHAMFRSLASRPDAAALFGSPVQAVDIVNGALAIANATCMFVTLLVATFNGRTKTLTYVRAGHVPPYLRRADGTVLRLDAKGGMPIGLFEDAVHLSATVELAAGDELLIVTDGITEAADLSDQLYGDLRVEELLAKGEAGSDPMRRLFADVRAFEAGRPASDDIAAILLTLEQG